LNREGLPLSKGLSVCKKLSEGNRIDFFVTADFALVFAANHELLRQVITDVGHRNKA